MGRLAAEEFLSGFFDTVGNIIYLNKSIKTKKFLALSQGIVSNEEQTRRDGGKKALKTPRARSEPRGKV